MSKIGLFDPSLKDNNREPSVNLGDIIISKSIEKCLNEMFSNSEVIRISSHVLPSKKEFNILNECELIFIGGTNILSSEINKYNQWKVLKNKFNGLFSSVPIENIILLGVGWWQYQSSPEYNTKKFYEKILSKNKFHSVRDKYTLKMLESIDINNVLNTSCPTTWELNGQEINRKLIKENCLFTITDYMKDVESDNSLIQIILDSYSGKIFFFPQGTGDVNYITLLSSFKKNKERITVLNRTIDEFEECLTFADVDYVGTRLHAGINALQLKKNSLILSVDNRATEMAKDISLPVVSRKDLKMIRKWINGDNVFSNIKIPIESITLWKNQFKLM